MGRAWDYLVLKTDESTAAGLIESGGDSGEQLKVSAEKLINHDAVLGSLAFGTSFLKWVASFAAM